MNTNKKFINLWRLLAITSFGFTLTLITNILEPGLFGHQIIRLAPEDKLNTVLGLTTFLGSVVAVLVLPASGVLSDRTVSKWGRRIPYLAIGGIIITLALFVIALSDSLILFLAGVILYFVSENMILGPWMALYPDNIPKNQMGRAAGIKSFADIAGLIIGRQSAGYLIGNFIEIGDIALIYLIMIPIIVLAFSIVITVSTISKKSTPKENIVRTSVIQEFKNIFNIELKKYPAFKWWFINRFLFWCGFIILSTFLLFFLIDVINLTEFQAQSFLGTLATVLGGAIMLVSIPVGRWSDKVGRKPFLIAAGILASIGTFIILIVKDLPLIIFGGALIGLAAGIFITNNFALITTIIPKYRAGKYLGISGIASVGASATARLLGGLIVDPINNYYGSNVLGYNILYGLAVILFLLSALSAFILPENNLR